MGFWDWWIFGFAFDPRDAAVVWMVSDRGLFRTTNGGTTWSPIAQGAYPDGPTQIAIHQLHPETVFLGTPAGVYRSENAGVTWAALNEGLEQGAVCSLAVDPLDPGTLYAGMDGPGFFRRASGATAWERLNSGLSAIPVASLTYDETTETIYAGTYDAGVVKSTDAGRTWKLTGLHTGDALSVIVDPFTPHLLYAAGWNLGIVRSRDGGDTWEGINQGIKGRIVLTLLASRRTQGVLYAGGEVIYRSDDAGDHWYALSLPAVDWISTLVSHPAAPEQIYAGSLGGVLKSFDDGASWHSINAGLTNRAVDALIIDPQHPQKLYLGTRGGGISKSTDGGWSWTSSSSGLSTGQVTAIAIDRRNPEILVAATPLGPFRTTDGGESWQIIDTGAPSGWSDLVAFDPPDSSRVFLALRTGELFARTFDGMRRPPRRR